MHFHDAGREAACKNEASVEPESMRRTSTPLGVRISASPAGPPHLSSSPVALKTECNMTFRSSDGFQSPTMSRPSSFPSEISAVMDRAKYCCAVFLIEIFSPHFKLSAQSNHRCMRSGEYYLYVPFDNELIRSPSSSQ
jgi:hypothetical protein